MAFGRTKEIAVQDQVTPRRRSAPSLVASAVQMKFTDASYNTYRFRDESWQRELWRLYDIIPEFGYAARWVGSCCSQVRIYVAEVDKLGRVQGETTDEKINALSDSLLGGPSSKAECLRAMGINLTVAGEAYVLGRTNDDTSKDEWFILSSSEFRRVKGCGDNGGTCLGWGDKFFPQIIDLATQVVTRVWTPHPMRIWLADSPSRSCQPVLRELEQLTKYVFSQIDSRLVGAGLLVIPNNLDFPAEDGQTDAAASDTLMMKLVTAGAASLRGEGTAMAVLPHVIEANPEDVERGFKLIQFASELSKQAMDLRTEAVRRLATGMDMPAEALTGMGDTNHWNGWFIDGYGIKVHIEPLMNRICQALTTAYLAPALKLMGKDPKRYQYSFDTAPLAVRPQRLQDALNLYEKEILSADAVREAGNFKESDAPSDDELAQRRTIDVTLRDPNLFQKLGVRELMGITEEMLPQDEFVMATPGLGSPGGPGAPPPPPPPTGIQSELPPPMPNTLGEIPPPNGAPPGGTNTSGLAKNPPTGVQASAREELALVVLAEAAVRRGMEVAGKRLLDRHNRDRWPDVPHFDLHTRIRVTDTAHATRLLNGAWEQVHSLVDILDADVDPERLRQSLHRYCCTLLTTGSPHEPQNLFAMLRAEGLIHG
jgi:hypothetical protein